MIKRVIKFLIFLSVLFIIVVSYLSYYGINTVKFNEKIKTEILKKNKKIRLELKEVKLLLNPLNFTINVKTFDPKIYINNEEIELKLIITNISLKSYINNEFSVDDLQISTKEIELNRVILIARSFKNSAELFILNNVVENGFLKADINLKFNKEGKFKDDYEIKGSIKNGKLNFFKENNIDDLNFIFTIKDQQYFLKNIETKLNGIELSSSYIDINEKDNGFIIDGKLKSNEKNIHIRLFKKFFKNNFKKNNIENLNFSSENEFSFNISKKFKFSNLNLKSIINLNNIDYKDDLLIIKKYLPNFKDTIKFKDHEIIVNFKKNQLDISGSGKIIAEEKTDTINYIINKIDNKYIFDVNFKINENFILIETLEYKKNENITSELKFKGSYNIDKKIKFDLISFNEDNNNFLVKNLELNKQLKIIELFLVDLDYVNYNKIKNKINLNKNKKKYFITGRSFSAVKLIDKMLNSTEKQNSSLFYDLDSIIDLKVDKIYLDKDTYIENLSGNIKFANNQVNKLKLDSTSANNKKLTFTINTNKDNEKITTIYSSYPKPLLKQYKFIKGFEEGILDFHSIKKDGVSNSLLVIDNFKVQEVPVLAKLLTLASLQGIADLLTGEGIRFTDFEMKFTNKEGLMRIEEMYAIGPAISILMDGYIESKKLISLRGTLVPATTINRSIASIPVIGNILIGKKTGEGIFGVSFKIKGAPNSLKTTVNPIKTLTPRFITRTLEKLKKN